ncbi:hypothetical protein QBC43DRAFT_104046 [Cladorrhinum sp. PSN259]|nr:hypothetical protein QBC43DRAFT_104046 [Cladorrhinum sp. PSN259]
MSKPATRPRYEDAIPAAAFVTILKGPYPYSGLQIFGFFLLAFFPLLSITACVLRIWSRRISNGLGLDDWLIFLATALGIPQAVFAAIYMRVGYWGIHDVDIPPHPKNQGFFWAYLNGVFYSLLLCLIKISALLFLLRLGGTKQSVHRACWALIGFNIMQLCAFLPASVFTCSPVEFAWKAVSKGRCFSGGPFALTLASTNILTDILTLLVPFMAFRNLKLTNRIRYTLVGVFTLGALVTCISGIRLFSVIRVWYIRPKFEARYSIGYTTNTIEANLAIVTATVPTLWPLARTWFPNMFESMGINRPYLFPEIEVRDDDAGDGGRGDRSVGRRGDGQQKTTTMITPNPLRAKILWLQRPRTPSFVLRSPTLAVTAGSERRAAGPMYGGYESDGAKRSDIPGWRAAVMLGGTAATRKASLVAAAAGNYDEEEEVDYHGIIRRTDTIVEHDMEGEDDGDSGDVLIIQKLGYNVEDQEEDASCFARRR